MKREIFDIDHRRFPASSSKFYRSKPTLSSDSPKPTNGHTTFRVGELADGFYIETDGVDETPVADGQRTAGWMTEAGYSGLEMPIVREIVVGHGWHLEFQDAQQLPGVRVEIRN